MIIRIIRYILIRIFWRLFFRQINRIDFLNLINNISAILLTFSLRNILIFLKDIIFDRYSDNVFFRLIHNNLGLQFSTLTDTSSKRIFWVGFVFSLVVLRWFILFKRLILWPFKLGIYAFLGAVSGFDMSWLLGWFDIFYFNIPKWVYIQYLTLYSNWIGWWKNSVKIKNLNTESIPSVNKSAFYMNDSIDSIDNNNSNINKTKLFIIVGAVILIGVGVWYYYNGGFGGPGSAGNPIVVPNPPAPTSNVPLQPISITDNQTPSTPTIRTFVNPELTQFANERGFTYDPTRFNLLDKIDAQRRADAESFKENIFTDLTSRYNPENQSLNNEASTSTPSDYRVTRRVLGGSSSPPSPTGSDGSGETIRPFTGN